MERPSPEIRSFSDLLSVSLIKSFQVLAITVESVVQCRARVLTYEKPNGYALSLNKLWSTVKHQKTLDDGGKFC